MKFEIKYHVNPESRIIIAMLTVTGDNDNNYPASTTTSVLYDDLKAAGAVNNSGKYSLVNLTYHGAVLPRKYIAIARCSSGDEFDAEFGKKLARTRAYAKYYEKRARVMRSAIKELNRFHADAVSRIESMLDREILLRNSFAKKFNEENGGDYMPSPLERRVDDDLSCNLVDPHEDK